MPGSDYVLPCSEAESERLERQALLYGGTDFLRPFVAACPGAVPAAGFPGDLVLDPLCGSGTTCVAARRLGRRFVGIDLNPEFCALAERRLAATPVAPAVMSGKRPEERRAKP